MTIQEYADSRGISYNSARKLVERYRSELIITKDGRTQQLDSEAVAILDRHRADNPDPTAQKILQLQQRVDELEAEIQRLRSRNLVDRILNR